MGMGREVQGVAVVPELEALRGETIDRRHVAPQRLLDELPRQGIEFEAKGRGLRV